MAMFPIATASPTGRFDFTNIPQTFDHLQIRGYVRCSTSATTANLVLQFNSDNTGSNYNSHNLQGDGASASSSAQGTSTYILGPIIPAASATSGIYAAVIIDIYDYKSTTKNKTIRITSGYDLNGSGVAQLKSGVWFATPAAITLMSFDTATGFASGSRIDLYGITTSQATGA